MGGWGGDEVVETVTGGLVLVLVLEKVGRGMELRERVGEDVNGSEWMAVISSSSSNHASSSSSICRGSLRNRLRSTSPPWRIPGLEGGERISTSHMCTVTHTHIDRLTHICKKVRKREREKETYVTEVESLLSLRSISCSCMRLRALKVSTYSTVPSVDQKFSIT